MPAAPQRCNASTQRLNITITNRQRTLAVDSRLLRRIVETLLTEMPQISQADLAIHLIATSRMTRLNESFLHHVGSTDVITFDYLEQADRRTQHVSSLHGEIFVCVNEAVAQARRFRTVWQSELVRYTVHGILHLLGFDDSNAAARRKMKRAEEQMLRALGRRFHLSKLARTRAPLSKIQP